MVRTVAMKFLRSIAILSLVLSLGTSSSAKASELENYDVQIVKGSNINLVSQDSRVPILVRNNYGTEVRVLIHVTTSNLRVRLPKVTAVTIPANSTVNATVPVLRIGENMTISMNVLGNYEAIAIGSLSFLVAALFVVGTIRMLRRRRMKT